MGESNEKSLFERSEFMIFQTNKVFLRVEKFELEVLSTFLKVGFCSFIVQLCWQFSNKKSVNGVF